MASSDVEICNIALGWLGVDPITSLDDNSNEARLCKLNYPLLRDAVLEDRAWTFALDRRRLTKSLDVPDWGWSSQFILPADCLRVIEVFDESDPVPGAPNLLRWEKERNKILCDADTIYISYIAKITDVTLFSPGFVQSLAKRIAADLAIPITESRTLAKEYNDSYEYRVDSATAVDGSQGRNQKLRFTKLTRIR